ncbi:metallophosphoesterase [Candidatus Falkowbacteria bacterium CG10_big_fil_rev_8_21_14_0_10_37_6]|uniref:Metallophosphoesterase n=1 Tax=Candidatus Falkowbacteria bacterium CG10_big_fil_rev_8_21_14_0_10_37_6 TaxID=1974563 RepID=A0A2H0V760_9BACT|nr:MAG: metallophosphoesterase [Candidatus Falkowbacteria bacterium CG10_big_fil_rev_8_21_14_0_10_37_6]
MLKILFIGDVVGYIGREAVKNILPKIKKKYKPDLIIANAENLAHGKGVTENTLTEMLDAGIDYFTGGNHIFSKKNHEEILNNPNFHIVRPANYPDQTAGFGEKVINISQKNILLINLMGRVFFRENIDCPFRVFDRIIKKYKNKNIDAVVVDFHAEATSEKKAFFHYAKQRAQIIVGTHTHIQTNDALISPFGTAYITDVGAVAAADSILGVEKTVVIDNFLTQIAKLHEFPRQGLCEFNAIIVTVNTDKKIAVKIQTIKEHINIK